MAMQHIVCLPIIDETDDWHVVTVPRASPSVITAMTNWCREYPGARFSYYFRHPALSKIRHHQYGEFYFEDERDAMMFTLTWV